MGEDGKLKPQLRVMLGIVSIPGLAMFAMTVFSISLDGSSEIDSFSLIYGVLALFVLYLAVVGKIPKFLYASDTENKND
ncbi:MAG: hypothetical protein JJ957_20460 [Pseudomonadales bacterium]|nr:hypothetical protein [Pseudomonadales bacterium]MBO6598020.1 hypothetical protein [Pseudomonadales bacterium]MBO6824542.1 hypothetical protein [Pseudomonadales bacterium]